MRLSALSELGVIYVLTHDSIGLGEDGPTHQPIETLANLRAIPNLLVIRPGDGNETSGAYQVAVTNRKRPTVLALSRQAMANQAGSSAAAVAKGGYILEDSNGTPELILIGTGTELELATKAAAVLRAEGLRGAHRARIDAAQAALPDKSDFAALGQRNVVLIFVESYGAITARDPLFAASMDPLRSRLQGLLEQAGFATATGLVRSPITGGGSWMGHGTLLAGVKIAAQDAYEVMLVSRSRTLAHRLGEAFVQFGLVGIVGQGRGVVFGDHRDVVGTDPEPAQRPGQDRVAAAAARAQRAEAGQDASAIRRAHAQAA
jgi:hypothetical protein